MAFYNDRTCLSPVSKNTRGDLRVVKQERQRCAKPRCLTLKVQYRLKLDVRTHQPCDRHRALDGVLEARFETATRINGQGRGVHQASFKWSSPAATITGRMQGITNAGTHRQPLDNCERCDEQGHMEGQLTGRIVEGKLKGCRVSASYVINYDPGTAGQNTGVRGTLEGVVICPCE